MALRAPRLDRERVPRRGACLLLALVLLACPRSQEPRGLGRRIAEAEGVALRASPDGAWLAYLDRCEPVKDRTLPPGSGTCRLLVAPAAGDGATRIADGVTTLPQGFAWSADGQALAALADYDAQAAAGTLVAWAPGATPRHEAEGVSFYAFARSGHALGLVSSGQLHVVRAPPATPEAVRGAESIATFEFGEGGVALLARRTFRAGGDLLAVRGAAAARLAEGVRDYGFARDGRRFAFTAGTAQALQVAWSDAAPSRALGRDVQSFVFSPRGDAVAFVADAAPGRQGDLVVAGAGRPPVRLARRVGEPRWSASGERLGWLEDYDPRSRTGTLGVGAPGARRVIARHVSDFDLTADGAGVAFLQHETAGGYSVDLGLARAGGEPVKVAKGAFGFSFSPDGRWLYYRTRCVREAEACDLLRVAVDAPQAKPEAIAEGAKSFEFAPGRPDRLLVSWARKDRVALDIAVWEGGKLTAVDTYVRPGTAQFLGGDSHRLAYAVLERSRQGIYVAQVP